MLKRVIVILFLSLCALNFEFLNEEIISKECSDEVCTGEWKINEAINLEKLRCPHCGKYDTVNYVMVDQREKYQRRWE